jgi:hypothetical protein
MLAFDHQMQFAAELTGRVAEASSEMFSKPTSLFAATEPRDEPGRSWYRAPTPNPFDWSSWMMPAAPQPSWPAWMTPQSHQPMMFGALPFAEQPWSALASFASTMAALQSYQRAWTPPSSAPAINSDLVSNAWQAMMWPLAQFNQMATAASPAANPYSSYRSDGGHAVAQIVPESETSAS